MTVCCLTVISKGQQVFSTCMDEIRNQASEQKLIISSESFPSRMNEVYIFIEQKYNIINLSLEKLSNFCCFGQLKVKDLPCLWSLCLMFPNIFVCSFFCNRSGRMVTSCRRLCPTGSIVRWMNSKAVVKFR